MVNCLFCLFCPFTQMPLAIDAGMTYVTNSTSLHCGNMPPGNERNQLDGMRLYRPDAQDCAVGAGAPRRKPSARREARSQLSKQSSRRNWVEAGSKEPAIGGRRTLNRAPMTKQTANLARRSPVFAAGSRRNADIAGYCTTRTAVTSCPSALPTKWIASRDLAFWS